MFLIQMIFAHLVGDYVLQTDTIADWKMKETKGVLVHGLIVFTVTILFALIVDYTHVGLIGALIIGGTHIVIDYAGFFVSRRFVGRNQHMPLILFILDQSLHLVVIGLVATVLGLIPTSAELFQELQNYQLTTVFLGYTLIAMPAWVVIEFMISGLVRGALPDFKSARERKLVTILERVLMTTLVLFGAVELVLLVTIPRLYRDRNGALNAPGNGYIAELLVSITLAIVVGYAVSQIVPMSTIFG